MSAVILGLEGVPDLSPSFRAFFVALTHYRIQEIPSVNSQQFSARTLHAEIGRNMNPGKGLECPIADYGALSSLLF